ncbi:MAG: cell wall-binding repeat-containing protein, partial [Actinomycetes bacterium]
ITRVWGATRQDTSVATSHATFPTGGSADAVVLADSYHFPDALSGAPLARFVNGPLLLTPGAQSTVWPSVVTEIARVLGSTSKPVYILGGTGSVSQADQDQLGALGYSVHRIGGANRYETSLNIAKFMGQGASAPGELLLATGTDFPDGLSAGAAAASYWTPVQTGGAVLLTNGAAMYPAIKTYVDAALAAQTLGRRVYVTTVGGLADKAYAGTASNPKISAVGADRYTTSAYVAEIHFGAQASVAIATGTSFPDALSGGAYAGAINAPLLLVPSSLVNEAHEFDEVPYFLNIASGAIVDAYIFGGTGVVNTAQRDQLASIIGLQVQLGEITPTSVLSARARGVGSAGTVHKPAPGAAAGSRAGAGSR